MIPYKQLVVTSVLLNVAWTLGGLDFPPGFRFGAATAAYQVEGAWNVSDKSPSIWDTFTRRPGAVLDGSTGDVACDSYHQWRRDIEVAKELGLAFYRFSLSWSRLLPSGFSNKVSADGAQYYNNLIDGLLAEGIEPVVTIFHWDLPQRLQDLGGWPNPLVSDWFADYSRVVFRLYGDRVKTWITINEPMIVCSMGYGNGDFAPGISTPGYYADYLCNKHIMLAHAKAWRIYDSEFRPQFGGKVAITNQYMWYEPETEDDVELTELVLLYNYGRYVDPIHSKEGGWPPAIEEAIARQSELEGHPRSKLPAFTDEEKELIRGTHDFVGCNHYTTFTVRKQRPGEESRSWPMNGAPDLGAIFGFRDKWKPTASDWFRVNPEGFRSLLVWLKHRYSNPEIFITENGYSSADPEVDDVEKTSYYRDYLGQVLLAMKEDGVNVTGYTAWTLIDNFEWFDGYTRKFGLYEVDFSSPQRTRTARESARYYANVVKHNSLNFNNK